MDLAEMRLNYNKSQLDFNNLNKNPIDFFLKWFAQASKDDKYESNACVLSTVSVENKPSSLVVLLKHVNDNGFIFFTNYKSDKSVDIDNNNYVALNFYWPSIEKQVRIVGVAKKISSDDSDNYFKNRPRESQMGAWLSEQSSSVDLNHNFIAKLDVLKSKFEGKEVNRPVHWGGYHVKPDKIEFWQGRPSRLHDRVLYEFDGKCWIIKRLSP